jgi:hypothetical protein
MNTNPSEKYPGASREEILAALFAQLVLQQTNMALMLLGKIANPQTGEVMRDTDAAGFFIDQLEMLEAKTRGNLGREEENLLKQSLMSLRLAFVEVVNSPETAKPAGPAPDKAAPAPPVSPEPPSPAAPATPGTAEDSSGKRFSKKY